MKQEKPFAIHATSFLDLEAWQQSHKLVRSICALTKSFPRFESYRLTSQLRQMIVSVSSDIATGFSGSISRDGSGSYVSALISLKEVHELLKIAHATAYIDLNIFEKLQSDITAMQNMINGLLLSPHAQGGTA